MTSVTDLARQLSEMERRLRAVERGAQMPRTSLEGGALVVNDTDGTPMLAVGELEAGSGLFAVAGMNGGQVVANDLDLPEGTITETDISDSAISTPKLRANAVTADKIFAGSVTADKIAANAVTAGKIAAGVITADRLAVGVIASAVIYEQCNDVGAWRQDGGGTGTITSVAVADNPAGPKVWRCVGNVHGLVLPHNIPVDPTALYRIRMRVRNTIAPSVPGTQLVYLGFAGVAADGVTYVKADNTTSTTAVGAHYVGVSGGAYPVGPGWTEIVGYLRGYGATVGTGGARPDPNSPGQLAPLATFIRPVIHTNYNSGDGTTEIGLVEVAVIPSMANGAVVIADGQVDASKFRASSRSGARAEVTPWGLQLYDAEGNAVISLLSNSANYLEMTDAGGNNIATISEGGAASFESISVDGDIEVMGRSLLGALGGLDHPGLPDGGSTLDMMPRGIVAFGEQVFGSTYGTGTDTGMFELAFEARPNRVYAFRVSDSLVSLDMSASTTAHGYVGYRFRIEYPAAAGGVAAIPTFSSPVMGYDYKPVVDVGSSAFVTLGGHKLLRCPASGVRGSNPLEVTAGTNRVLVSFYNPGAAPATFYNNTANPLQIWVEDIGMLVPETGVLNNGSGGATPPKSTYTKTYDATWSGAYDGSGAYESWHGSECFFGYLSSTNGNQKAMIGFPYTTIQSDLSGAAVSKVEVYLYANHWYYNAGGTMVIGYHAAGTTRPGSFSGTTNRLTSTSWPKPGGRWVNITSQIGGSLWAAGTARGIVLGPGPSTAWTYYGRVNGFGMSSPPKLRITYTK